MRCLAMLLGLLTSFPVRAQHVTVDESPYFINYSYKDGLPSNESYFVLQDSKKRIWIATDNGVGLMSGGRIKLFNTADGLIDNVVLEIYEDPAGRIWFLGLGKKLCYYESGKIIPYRYNDILETKIPVTRGAEKNIVVDEFGTLHIGFISIGSFSIDKNGRVSSPQPSKNRVQILTVGSNKMWNSLYFGNAVAHSDSVYIENELIDFIPKTKVNKMLIDNSDSYFLIGDMIISLATKKIIHRGHQILSINSYGGKIYVGTRMKGFYILDPKTQEVEEPKRYLNHLSVTSVQVDHQGGVWCSTLEKGLFYCSEFNLQKVNFDMLQNLDYISSIKDVNGSLYIGFSANKWAKLTGDQFVAYDVLGANETFFGKIGNEVIRSNVNGVNIKNKFMPIVMAIDYYEDENSTVFGYTNIYRVSKDLEIELICDYNTLIPSRSNRRIRTIICDGPLVWVGDLNGVFSLKNSRYTGISCNKELEGSSIIDLEQLKGFGMLIATDNKGIVVVDKNGNYNANLTQKLEVIGNCITSLHTSADNQLFASSNKGIYRVRIVDGNPLVDRLSSNPVVRYKEVTMLSFRDDKLFIGTKTGLYTLSEISKIRKPKSVNEIHYAGVTLERDQSKTLHAANDLHFGHKRNSFTIHFYSSDYRSEPIFRYRLNEDAAWIETDDNFLSIQNIEPGDYRIEICQLLSTGQWTNPHHLLSINISKPVWQNAWFIISIFLTSVFLLVVIIREIRINRLKKSRKLMLAEHSALKAQMKPHFIFNSLNSIQRLILFNQNEDALEYLSRFSGLSRRLLSSSKSGLHTLREEVDFVSNYISLESLRYKDKFSSEIAADFTVEQFALLVPNMMVQPFIENAIQHAFIETKSSNQIKVEFKIQQRKLIISVIDNGVGRQFAQKNKKDGHDSYGIQIVRDRLNLLRTKSDKFALSIYDLCDNEGSLGTHVIIELPLTNS